MTWSSSLPCKEKIHSHIISACMLSRSILSDSLQPHSPLSFSVHGSFYARILEGITKPSSRGSSRPRSWIQVSYLSCIAGELFTCWVIEEAPYHPDFPLVCRLITKVIIYNSICSNLLQHCISYWILSHFSMNIGVYRFSCILRKVLKKKRYETAFKPCCLQSFNDV